MRGRSTQRSPSVLWRNLIPVLTALLLAACAQDGAWLSPLARDHPLVGRVWQPVPGRFTAPADVAQAAAAADFLLLGETHDNPDHHRLQARLVGVAAETGRRPAVVFEMIAEDQGQALARWRADKPENAAALGDAVGWKAAGWPAFSTYRAIAEAALAADLPIRAGSPPRALVRKVGRQGLKALDGPRRRLLSAPQPKPAEDGMRRALFDSHCGLVPKSALTPMLNVQRMRDAILADNMLRNADGAVLITGSGHARKDFGVPLHLARRAPGRKTLAVAFVEVADGETAPESYAETFGGVLPFDYVWFTPRFDDTDHCAELEKRFRMHRAG